MDTPNYTDVVSAAERLEGVVNRTPIFTSRTINEFTRANFFIKCENYQRTGAFKFRGAFSILSKLTADQRIKGVVTYSSGNHSQGVALAAKLLGIPATIFMAHDAPEAKVAATNGYGATVIPYDRTNQNAETLIREFAETEGRIAIHPFDHPDIICGQGTAAKELFEDVGELDALFVPLGGGGLLSGTALSTRALSKNCELYGVEPEAGNDGQQSFRKGSIVHIPTPSTIADGAHTQQLGKCTFPIIKRDVNDILTVSDSKLITCMRFFAERMKMIVEPTGCLGLAAAIDIKEKLQGKRVGVIISGGNVDLDKFFGLVKKCNHDSLNYEQ